MKIILFEFDLLQFHKCDNHWWFAIGLIEADDFNGALLYIEKDWSWNFDFLYLRWFIHRWYYE